MDTWNKRLAQAVAESKYTPNGLASELNVSAPTVAAWIGAAKIKPAQDITANNLFRVCKLLDVRPEWILFRRPPKKSGTELSAQIGGSEAHVYPDVTTPRDAVKSEQIPTALQMKQEINTALGTEGLSDELLYAVCLMIRAGTQAPVQGDQHHTKRVRRKNGHSSARKTAESR